MRDEPQRQRRVRELARRVRSELSASGFETAGRRLADHPDHPWRRRGRTGGGDEAEVGRVFSCWRSVRRRCRKKASRLRVTLSCDHTDETVNRLLKVAVHTPPAITQRETKARRLRVPVASDRRTEPSRPRAWATCRSGGRCAGAFAPPSRPAARRRASFPAGGGSPRPTGASGRSRREPLRRSRRRSQCRRHFRRYRFRPAADVMRSNISPPLHDPRRLTSVSYSKPPDLAEDP